MSDKQGKGIMLGIDEMYRQVCTDRDSLREEVKRLKAELDSHREVCKTSPIYCQMLEKDRDSWKQKCEEMAKGCEAAVIQAGNWKEKAEVLAKHLGVHDCQNCRKALSAYRGDK